ncbi:MAG: hypothetical protein ACI8Y7_000123 [Candidatus Woesearchaeota archaeon]|jgi:hypothetical protein
MKKRAVFFTLDAFFALLVVFIIGTFIFVHLNQATVSPSTRLQNLAQDSLLVLELNGTLSNAVAGSNATIVAYLNTVLPQSVCGNITIFDASDTLIRVSHKEACNTYTPSIIQTAQSSIFSVDEVYYVTAEFWRNVK